MGRVFNTIVRFGRARPCKIHSAGLRCSRAKSPKTCFRSKPMNGWSFDVEILYAAQKRGYHIVEVPIHWYYKANTRIHPMR